MKIFIVWLLMMYDHTGSGEHIVTAMAHEDVCQTTADKLNASAGDHRAMHWNCPKQAVER